MLRFTSRLALIGTISVFAVGCSQPAESPVGHDPTKNLQTLIDMVVADDEAIHGAALAVFAPSTGLAWEGSAGLADPESGIVMTPANPVRIASNTKTYVAAAILRLVEDDRLELDDSIAEHLPVEVVDLLDGDGYDIEAITIRHLLTHTSGLFDQSETGAYTDAIVADPQHRWTPMEQITMGDLARFFGGVFRGDVYHDPGTLDVMLSTYDDLALRSDAGERTLPPGAYRMGVWVLETEGITTYHHTGFWGTMEVHVPELDLTVAATVNQNQSKPVFDRILIETIRIVEESF